MQIAKLPVLPMLVPWLSLLGAGRLAAEVLQYDITDPGGTDLPAKMTFLTREGKVPDKLDIKSRVPEYAARKNVVYELYGKGEVPLPAGSFKVYVSRGMESMRGFDIFMRVAKRVYERLPDVVFLVVASDRVAYGGDVRRVPHRNFK